MNSSLLLTACMCVCAFAFPNGAPDLACKGMVPGHLPTTTSGETPFKLRINATTYKPGDIISGELYSDANLNFKGFLIEVGAAEDTTTREQGVGEFLQVDDTKKHVCDKAGLTHTKNNEKQKITFVWRAPEGSTGDLSVRATVVQKFFPSQFWVGSFSERIKAA